MEEEKKHIDELIATYLTEGLDKNALAELKAWIAASPENEDYFIQQREVWFSAVSREAASKYNKDKAFDTFKNRIGSRKQVEKAPRQEFRLSALWRYAAIIAVILAVGCFSYWQGGVNVKDTFADISVEAPLGSRTKLYLPDGTLVWLNAGSRMTYSQGFGVDNRMIELEGEGYFEVTRDETRPFRVVVEKQTVEVLGTEFNVDAYPEEKNTYTTLVSGKVKVDTDGQTVILDPGMQSVVNDEKMYTRKVNVAEVISWRNGMFVLENHTLEEIMSKLARWYDFTVFYQNMSLKEATFKGKIPRYASFESVLNILEKTGEVKFNVKNQIVTVYQ